MGRALTSLCTLLLACQDLTPATPGVCGNGVVEPELGEDCEPLVDGSAACGAVDEAACRWICSEAVPSCPTGWVCETTRGLCHHGAGAVEELGNTAVRPGAPLHGDVNGDGFEDLATISGGGAEIYFGDGAGFPTSFELSVGAEQSPGMGDLDADGLDDFAVGSSFGLFVALGSRDDAVIPQGYPFLDVSLMFSDGAPLSVRADPMFGPAQLPAMLYETTFTTPTEAGLAFLLGDLPLEPFPDVPTLASVRGPVSIRDVDGVFGDEVAVAIDRPVLADQVLIYTTSTVGGYTFAPLTTVDLPAGREITYGATFLELTGDGNPDLLIATSGGATDLVLAVGDGAGGFAAPGDIPDLPADQMYPLAVGDLNADGRDDLVSRVGVIVTCGGGLCPRALTADPWKKAVIGDFNGDGWLDIAATSDAHTECRTDFDLSGQIDLLLGDGSGWFSQIPFALDAPAMDLAVADFDGDRVDDLAVVMPQILDGERKDAVAILYGQPMTEPARPAVMGRFDNVTHLGPMIMPDPLLTDMRSDMIATVTRCDEGAPSGLEITLFIGLPENAMLSPYMTMPMPDDERVMVSVHPSPGASPGAPLDLLITSIENSGDTWFYNVWRAAGQPGALFEHPDEQYVATELVALPACTLWANADLDADGRTEIVGVSGTASVPLNAEAAGYRLGLDNDCPTKLWLIDAPAALGTAEIESTTLLGEGVRNLASVRLLDVDLDGAIDLVLSYYGSDPTTDLDDEAGPAVVRWGADYTIGDAETPVAFADGVHPVAATALNVDGDELLELAVLTTEGLFFVDQTAPRVFAAPVLVAPPVATAPPRELRRTRLDAFDVDGDGLDDLIASAGLRNERVCVLRTVSHLE